MTQASRRDFEGAVPSDAFQLIPTRDSTPEQPLHAATVDNIVLNCVDPELRTLKKYRPAVYEKVCVEGIQLVFCFDASSCQDFHTHSTTYEVGCYNMITGDAETDTQSGREATIVVIAKGAWYILWY